MHSRSQHGCLTCRDKKVKCDETHPRCQRCTRLDRECDYSARVRKKYTRKHHQALSTPPTTTSTPNQAGQYPTGLLPQETILSELDHEAIHYIRFIIAPRVDTRRPEYSGPAIIWTLSQKSPMVHHMLCALGSMKLHHDLSFSISTDIPRRKSIATAHYGAALRMLGCKIDNLGQESETESDIEFVLATLWLMVSYELAHGDGTGEDLAVHLRGAAVLLQGRLPNRPCEVDGESGGGGGGYRITRLTAQLLLWIAMVDGSAALSGFDATFNALLEAGFDSDNGNKPTSRLERFSLLQRHATMVYHDVWGAEYPQSELIEDLQCSPIFCLQAETGQLRYMLSTIAGRASSSHRADSKDRVDLGCALRDVERRYSELIASATLPELPSEGPQRRYVLNLRMVVPFFHAVVLLFHNLSNDRSSHSASSRRAVSEIMTLAFQAYIDQENNGVYRIAWPLFVAALELDDLIHRAWALERFAALAQEGENLRRAHAALSLAFSRQTVEKRRIGYLELLQDQQIMPFVLE
ncbi:fungal-specific transcription factor domain-containing protein [Aspergillus unguis]